MGAGRYGEYAVVVFHVLPFEAKEGQEPSREIWLMEFEDETSQEVLQFKACLRAVRLSTQYTIRTLHETYFVSRDEFQILRAHLNLLD